MLLGWKTFAVVRRWPSRYRLWPCRAPTLVPHIHTHTLSLSLKTAHPSHTHPLLKTAQKGHGRAGLLTRMILARTRQKRELPFVSALVSRLLKLATSQGVAAVYSSTHSASRNADFLRDLFSDPSNREAFLQHSLLFELVQDPESYPRHIRRSARCCCSLFHSRRQRR